MTTRDRPLSPHLQIYRWQWTMLLSILHRMTGVGLAGGTLLLIWWLVAAAAGPEAYGHVQGFVAHWFGRLVMLGFTWAFFYHLANGIRHLIWDTGRGFELKTGYVGAWIVALFSIALTILAWLIAYGINGG